MPTGRGQLLQGPDSIGGSALLTQVEVRLSSGRLTKEQGGDLDLLWHQERMKTSLDPIFFKFSFLTFLLYNTTKLLPRVAFTWHLHSSFQPGFPIGWDSKASVRTL